MKNLCLSLLLLGVATSNLTAQVAQESTDIKIPAKVYFRNGKLTFASEDDKFKLWFDNRIYLDAAYYSPSDDVSGLSSKANKDLEQDDSQFRFNNGAILRRARFAVKATLYDKWFAELDMDFGYNEIELKDMYLGYKINNNVMVKAGHFKEPMSMDRLHSSKYISLMERAMVVDAFGGGRKLGASATAWGNHWWVSGGIFGQQIDILQKEKNRGNDGWGFTGKVATSPILKDNMTLHLGGYASWRTPNGLGAENRSMEFRTFPESRVDRRRFVRAEIPNVENYSRFGIEGAYQVGKFLAQGEYIFNTVSRYKMQGNERVALKNAEFNGWYATASYMILGAQKRYDREDAEFDLGSVRKGGNLEIAARVSTINMNDFHDPLARITGGEAISYSAQVNYYANRNIVFGLNYTYMDNDKYADDKGHITLNGRPLSSEMKQGVDFGVVQMRMMVSF